MILEDKVPKCRSETKHLTMPFPQHPLPSTLTAKTPYSQCQHISEGYIRGRKRRCKWEQEWESRKSRSSSRLNWKSRGELIISISLLVLRGFLFGFIFLTV